jgi:hypothetical protein
VELTRFLSHSIPSFVAETRACIGHDAVSKSIAKLGSTKS